MFASRSASPRSVLVVAAHPDDEVLGMGGTIARHVHAGDRVSILYMADGVGSRGAGGAEVEERRAAAQRACAVLGAEIAAFQQFPDNEFDTVAMLRLAQAVEAVKRTVQPEVVYTHHGGDLNVDHRQTCRAVLTAFRMQPGERATALYAFEVASSTEWNVPSCEPPFLPDTFVDTTAFYERAIEAYSCYEAEVRDDPHARSLNALRVRSEHRGRQVGITAAEAFVTLRRVVR